MNKLILSTLVAGAAFAGFMGTQIAQSAQAVSASITTPAQLASLAKRSGSQNDDNMQTPNPVVVELFTSQGCSSCPPADMLASRLAKDSSLLVITRPVTYWDRLGWKDTLAKEDNTRLQRAYAAKGQQGSGVYTPQMVVNGGGGAVGSRENDVRSLVRMAQKASAPTIETSRDDSGQMIVTISGKTRHMAGVSLIAMSSSEKVNVGRGENGGRILHYTNVVKAERNLGSWTGEPVSFVLDTQDLNVFGADKYAIVVQQPGAGAIVGAKLLEI